MSDSSAGGPRDNTILPSQWHQFLHQLLPVIVLLGLTPVSWELLGTQALHSCAIEQ